MNISVIFESLKFFKLKSAKTVQIWFVLLYALNVSIYFLPFADSDFSGAFRYAEDIAMASQSTQQYLIGLIYAITPGNWIMIGLSFLMNLIGLFFSLMYATLFIGEKQGLRPRQALTACLAALPRLLVLVLAFSLAALVTFSLFLIPAIIFIIMMYFAPLNMTLGKQKLLAAIKQSYEYTAHRKFLIFSQFVMLWAIVSLPSGIILDFIPGGPIPYAVVATFFTVLSTLMQGRLMGLLYVILVKKDQTVIPSESDKQDKTDP